MEIVTEQNQLDIINFTNIDSEDFEGMWGGNPTTIKAGETRPFARFMAQHFAKHLTDKILLRQNRDYNDGLLRQPLEDKILGKVAFVPEIVKVEEIKVEEFAEMPKDEPAITADSFKCEVCGKVAASKIGLAGHKRSHK